MSSPETGGLLRIAIKLMRLFATKENNEYVNLNCPFCLTKPLLHSHRLTLFGWKYRDFISLVNLIALYYQIRDDYMTLQSDEVSTLCICLLVARRLDHRDTTMQVQIKERLR